MKRRFILLTETLTAEQETQLRTALGSPYWWHWLPNAWLIVDFTNLVTVHTLNAAFHKVAPRSQCLVLEVDHKAWNSMELPTPNGKLSDWIKTSWVPS